MNSGECPHSGVRTAAFGILRSYVFTTTHESQEQSGEGWSSMQEAGRNTSTLLLRSCFWLQLIDTGVSSCHQKLSWHLRWCFLCVWHHRGTLTFTFSRTGPLDNVRRLSVVQCMSESSLSKSCFSLSTRLTFADCLFFQWFPRAQEPLGQMKGWALVFSPLSLCPAQPAGCHCTDEIEMRLTTQQLVLLWANHSQRADHGLIWFFTAWPYFSHQRREWPLNSSPLHFWSNLHHMPLKGDEPTGGCASL